MMASREGVGATGRELEQPEAGGSGNHRFVFSLSNDGGGNKATAHGLFFVRAS